MLFSDNQVRRDRLIPNFGRLAVRGIAALSTCITLYPIATLAADNSNLSNAKATYQSDRAKCNSGQTNQDRATCLKEAGAAYIEAKRGQFNNESTQYEQNAMARCKALRTEDVAACERRVRGEGIIEGSVEDGGIYRRIETYIPASGSPQQPPARY